MHICLLCEEYPPAPHGGNGSLYSDLAEGLVAAGHRVTVVGIYSAALLEGAWIKEEIRQGVRVVRLRQSPVFLRTRPRFLADRYRLLRWLKREHKRNRFDLIECADYAGWLCFGGPRGVPTVVRIGGSNFFYDHELGRQGYAFENARERACIARATHLGAVSAYAAKGTLELCGTSNRECRVIHNAVDTRLFAPVEDVRTEQGLVVYVNALNQRKGTEQLIRAMNIVFDSHPKARLVVIGEDTQANMRNPTYLERLQASVRPEFRGQVEFTGRLGRHTGVLDYLQRAHLCCYPSRMETFGIAPVEAMAVGKPTIFIKTGPGPEIIEDGISGLLCDPSDPQDIAAKIISILDDRDLAAKLGRNARERVLTLFDKDDWIARNVDFYQTCLRSA